MAKTTVSFDSEDIPTIIDALEGSLDEMCAEGECEDCTIRNIALTTAIEALFKKAKKVELVF